MRRLGVSSSRFEAPECDLMKIKTFENIIGQEIEAKSTKLGVCLDV